MLTEEALIAKVREIAANDPDYTYVHPEEEDGSYPVGSLDCMYLHSDDNGFSGGCIFGRALLEFDTDGSIVDTLEGAEMRTIDMILPVVIDGDISEKTIKWMLAVQNAQDGRNMTQSIPGNIDRKPWGEAVRIADEIAPLA